MNCPVCDERLRDVEKAGVVVALCPGCKGGWLDRGELAKLTGAAAGAPSVSTGGPAAFQGRSDADEERNVLRDRRDRRDEDDDDEDEGGRFGKQSGKRKRGGFFESIGDLFGD